ncbi:histidine kinase [Mucilaginibacter sp.]|uniref:sensor histidine kinase n=1 Tax=Mucilaginibacter sp. TaxID=1882438 RepID=UPI0026252291|nr:histidine kinase [Mucilaginibacter sp.]MDB5030425.1 histidine kinase [Mucilaginibacter sp.]
MKDLLKKPITFEKGEFWIATAVYVFSVYILAYNMLVLTNTGYVHTPNIALFSGMHMPYSHVKFYFIPQFIDNTVYYCAFLGLNFFIVPAIVGNNRVVLNIILLLLIFALMVIILGTADTWSKSYLFYKHSENYVYRRVFKEEFIWCVWAFMILGFYTIIKHLTKYSFKNFYVISESDRLTRECVAALGMWLLSVFFQLVTGAGWQPILIWSEVVLFAIGLYWYSFHNIIPRVVADGLPFKAFFLKILTILAIAFFPVALLMSGIFHRLEAPIIITLFNVGVGVFIVSPLAWYLYRQRLSKNIELVGLKTALGRSSANLDFLRSQINPHFLFNALNTLYGTALQENADRTGGGIQKLGDMMRFMLQENVQEHISLMREIDYLNNYIDLQKLRTQTSPDIVINAEIEESINGLQIAPMLLIPFVENAFKHGISLREPSHIKITLQTRGTQLLFDVYNSIHQKPDNDPEKNKSGIGLENVKQRLQLLYPKRHELVIRESAKEFFIHLTVNL